ncbi:MAG TPA: FMN-binding protein [Clostridia bacterium]|nr:FMN-binding protein [Clostridia bacterium]
MSIKRLAIGLVILLLAVGIIVYVLMVRQINKLEEQNFDLVDLASLPVGRYQGEATALLVTARVEVFLQDGRIQQVNLLEHRHGPGYGAEAIADSIVEANSPDVDSISGATASSIVVKTAVLEALKSAGTR